ncbi:MAG TPA: hypothetical protein EYP19_14275 [Desulfobacterales bacterium]|nr:hypothetical protein [Desulfobacterales bacterium]
MAWKAFKVELRLCTPLHSGWRKVGNLQMTRPYVTGRMLWGALTLRLTRTAAGSRSATDSKMYRDIGKLVHETLAFTYFYPALREENDFRIFWPWEDEGGFRRRFLSSYTGTALIPSANSAAEGTLHEVEFLSPQAMDIGEPVYLIGYFIEESGCPLNWREALSATQLGGERSYGWGLVELEGEPMEVKGHQLFDDAVTFNGEGVRPIISVPENGILLAHALATSSLQIVGEVEPLVGREWENAPGDRISHAAICFIPGSQIRQKTTFEIENYGLWKMKGCET